MYQIDNSTAATTQPASTTAGTPGFFTDGNAATGVAATVLPAEFMNALMLETLNVITAAGITPSKSSFTQLRDAIRALAQQGSGLYAFDTGAANAYAVAYSPAITTLTDGMVLRFSAANANTGASTFAPNGIAAAPVLGLAQAALQGGEILAGSRCAVAWSSALSSWVLLYATGGAQQVASGISSRQAVTQAQLAASPGRLLGVQVFATPGSFTYTPSAGTTSIVVEVQGGGGGGGGVGSTGSNQVAVAPGGNAGSYARSRITSDFAGVTVVVGQRGFGATAAAGGNGGTSSFGSFLTAPGGEGGTYYGAFNAPVVNVNGTGQSIAVGGNIDNRPGGRGAPGCCTAVNYGGSGDGGASVYGAGGPSAPCPANAFNNGNTASAAGAGGSGAVSSNGAGSAGGGHGGTGKVVIWEYA